MNNNLEYYINKNKHTCIKLPQKVSTCLQINNYLSEYTTDSERQQVLHNLGLDEIIQQFQTDIDSVEEKINNISLLDNCNIYNAKKEGTLQTIVVEVPLEERALGKIITFIDKNTHEWVIYQYCPTTLLNIENQWSDLSNWKKLYSKENFLFTSSKDIIKKTINGTQVILTIDANEQDIYNAKITHDGISIVKNFVEKGSKFNQQFIINDASSFEASGKINGQILTKYLTVDIAYPIFAGFADLSGVDLSSIYLHDLNLRVRDSGAINEGGIYNMELLPTDSIIKSTVVNPGYYNFVLAIPRNYSVDISMNGFSVPTQVEDINYSNDSPNYLDVEYKIYVSTNQYENGTYKFNITQQV